jgi:hypothetical protein
MVAKTTRGKILSNKYDKGYIADELGKLMAFVEDTPTIVDIKDLWIVVGVDEEEVSYKIEQWMSDGMRETDLPVSTLGIIATSKENVLMTMSVEHENLTVIGAWLLSDLLQLTS